MGLIFGLAFRHLVAIENWHNCLSAYHLFIPEETKEPFCVICPRQLMRLGKGVTRWKMTTIVKASRRCPEIR